MTTKTKLSDNFSLEELTTNNHGINVIANKSQINNLKNLCKNVLEPLREKMNEKIFINSGLRNKELNKIVGGVEHSQHLTGNAVDINAAKFTNIIVNYLDLYKIEYDQVIEYFDKDFNVKFVHVSYVTNRKNRNQHLKHFSK